MTEQAVTHYKDEINLLDIFVTLAESWRLLVLGPLIAAVLAGALSFLLPKTFESVAIMRLTEEEVALLHAAPVLDQLIEQFGMLAKADVVGDDVRQEYKKKIFFVFDKKSKLATITAKEFTAEKAQALGAAATSALLKELQVKGAEKALLEKIIATNERIIASEEDAIESIQQSFKKGARSSLDLDALVKSLVSIYTDMAKRVQENETIRQRLEVRGAEVYVQQPSLPQRKTSPKQILVMILALLGTSFALFMFVFVRKAWRNAEQDAESAKKIANIKQLLGFAKA